MQWVCNTSTVLLYILEVLIHNPPVLHPRHKLQYFKDVGWEENWVNTAKDIVRTEFDRKYTSLKVEEAPKTLKVCFAFVAFVLDLIHSFLKGLGSSSKNIFDNLPALSAPKKATLRDDLDRYLSTDPEDVTDALQWWYEHKHTYPHLHRMALDYLSIPGRFFGLYFIIFFLY